QSDVRSPVDEDVLGCARGKRGNRRGANFHPARSVTHAYTRRIGHQEMHMRVDRGGVTAIAYVRVDAVLMVRAGVVTIADHGSVRTPAIPQSSRTYNGFIAVAGAVHPDVHGLIGVHGSGKPGINE